MAIDAYSSLEQLGKALRAKDVSSLELTRFYLDRLERHGTALGAVVTITREIAESQARQADAEIAKGKWRGPLHGIPYGVKDLLATKGIPTTWGAEPYRDQVFDYDAEIVRRLTDAGAVLCAKLAMVELAGGFGYDTADASFTGPGRTPWNTGFWSGGSSSGPGAAVGAALVPYAIGSETSGSILTPAAFSGVSGLRPTYGLVSRHGAMALCWTLDKLGPMCRTIADCRIVMAVIAGHDPKDPSSLRKTPDWKRSPLKKRARIGVIRATFENVQPEVRANFEASVELMKKLGHEVVEMEIPDLPYGQCVSTIVDAEGASAFENLLSSGKAKQLRVEADKTGGYAGAATLAVDYLRAMRIRKTIRKELTRVLGEFDFLAGPTRSTVSYPVDVKFNQAYPGIRSGPSLIGAMNLVGAPAAVLPNGFGQNGLPTSLQIIAAPMKDREALAVADQVQNATDWHLKKPAGFE